MPELSLPPTEPMFSEPNVAVWDAIVMPFDAVTAPPLAIASEPPPYNPMVMVLSDQSDPAPVTRAELLEEPYPMIAPSLKTLPPFSICRLLPIVLGPPPPI